MFFSNKYRIPKNKLDKIYKRDRNCAYCHKKLIFPYNTLNRKDSATIEHLNFDGPFYWDKGLKIKDIVICCGSCNSSRGVNRLRDWFNSKYCIDKNINKKTVSKIVQEYLERNKGK